MQTSAAFELCKINRRAADKQHAMQTREKNSTYESTVALYWL